MVDRRKLRRKYGRNWKSKLKSAGGKWWGLYVKYGSVFNQTMVSKHGPKWKDIVVVKIKYRRKIDFNISDKGTWSVTWIKTKYIRIYGEKMENNT